MGCLHRREPELHPPGADQGRRLLSPAERNRLHCPLLVNGGSAGGVKSGRPASRYRNVAIASRATGRFGRWALVLSSSVQPVTMPWLNAQVMSPVNWSSSSISVKPCRFGSHQTRSSAMNQQVPSGDRSQAWAGPAASRLPDSRTVVSRDLAAVHLYFMVRSPKVVERRRGCGRRQPSRGQRGIRDRRPRGSTGSTGYGTTGAGCRRGGRRRACGDQ